jgi:flavin-dependent dehydrogenase
VKKRIVISGGGFAGLYAAPYLDKRMQVVRPESRGHEGAMSGLNEAETLKNHPAIGSAAMHGCG